jgi:hypothetical protein
MKQLSQSTIAQTQAQTQLDRCGNSLIGRTNQIAGLHKKESFQVSKCMYTTDSANC